MTTKKQLLNDINATEKKLISQQNRVDHCELYFTRLIHSKGFAVVSILLPAFLLGWNSGLNAHKGKTLRQLVKFLAITGFNYFRKKSIQPNKLPP